MPLLKGEISGVCKREFGEMCSDREPSGRCDANRSLLLAEQKVKAQDVVKRPRVSIRNVFFSVYPVKCRSSQ